MITRAVAAAALLAPLLAHPGASAAGCPQLQDQLHDALAYVAGDAGCSRPR